jgi:IS5 family transposase
LWHRSGAGTGADETTVCKFRHLLEEHELGERLFERVGEHLQAKGLRLSTGTIVDATIINAPSSTKNVRQERDPEMHQTRKGKQWCVSRTRAQARDAVSKMGDGLPKPAYSRAGKSLEEEEPKMSR